LLSCEDDAEADGEAAAVAAGDAGTDAEGDDLEFELLPVQAERTMHVANTALTTLIVFFTCFPPKYGMNCGLVYLINKINSLPMLLLA
jgi:hypothetical protein